MITGVYFVPVESQLLVKDFSDRDEQDCKGWVGNASYLNAELVFPIISAIDVEQEFHEPLLIQVLPFNDLDGGSSMVRAAGWHCK
jgi:hypothetical protein